jgi:hypothetical protein
MKKKDRKWPNSVDIGGMPYRIIFSTPSKCKKGLRLKGQEVYGSVDLGRNVIYIDKRYKDAVPFVLFHEIYHACCCHAGLPALAQDEEAVRPMTHLLFNALKQLGLVTV